MKAKSMILYGMAKKYYEMYQENRDDMCGIRLAVYIGLYYGCGGKRSINVPSYYIIPATVSLIIGKVKDKSCDSLKENIDLLRRTIEEYTDGDLRIIGVNNGIDYAVITITRVSSNYSFTLRIHGNKFFDRALISIAENIMRCYNCFGIETLNKQKLFGRCISSGLRYL